MPIEIASVIYHYCMFICYPYYIYAQISHWGNVEWHHEYSRHDLQARLSAAMLFVYLNSHSATSRPKNDVPNVS